LIRCKHLLRGVLVGVCALAIALACHAGVAFGAARGQAQGSQAQSGTAKEVGTIKAISGNTITMATDAGAEFTVQVEEATRMARVEPGQTDLKGATAMHLSDLQVGDRILARGPLNGKTIEAAVIIAMKHADVAAKQEQERLDWQKRGIGGLVSAVDPTSGTITITAGQGTTKKSVAIHTTNATVFRRYAPDSVKFDEAKPSSLGQVRVGDQLRARGNKNADGTEFAAEEVVSGSFRNIAGTISSVDPGAGTVTVSDLLTKKPVVVKITADSQVRKLPERMAQFIAIRLKGGGSGAAGNGSAAQGGQGSGAPREGEAQAGGQRVGGGRPGGSPDFQQILSRMPAATITDLQKGDAVMIVSTESGDSGAVTAITLLSGVDPILRASPNGQAMMLTPWSLGGGAAGDDAAGGSPE